MLHIVGIILKFIGITIAVILGIVLFLLCVILFIPIRYQGSCSIHDRKEGSFSVSFLLKLVQFKIDYSTENGIQKCFRIAGISMNRNRKKEKKYKKHAEKKGEKSQKKTLDSPPESISETGTQENLVTASELPENTTTETVQEIVNQADTEATEEGFFEKIFRKIRERLLSIRDKILHIKNSIKNGIRSIKNIWKKGQEWKEFLFCDNSRAVISFGKQELFGLLKYIRPTKVEGNVHFGFEDPSVTGQFLGFLSWFYGPFSKTLIIIPDFEEKILEGDISVKGRIRIYRLIFIGLKIYSDKRVKQFINDMPS